MISDTYRPKTPADCDCANALRDYERAHKIWMNTSVFSDDGKQAKTQLAEAREKLLIATQAAHPTWIVM